MKREKVFAASIISATTSFVLLTAFALMAILGMSFLQGGEGLIYGICMIGSLVFGVVSFILHTVAAVKARENNAKFGKKGLTITNIVFEVLLLATSVVSAVILGMLFGVFGAGSDSTMFYGFGIVFPMLLAAVATIICIIFNIVGLCGKKKVVAVEEAAEEKAEEQASV